MAFPTVHHWQDPIAGLREMRRVARRVVVFPFGTSDPSQFWLTRDYLPEVAALRACRVLASLAELARPLDPHRQPGQTRVTEMNQQGLTTPRSAVLWRPAVGPCRYHDLRERTARQ